MTPQTSDRFWRLLFVWQQNLGSTKSHHAKTGIRVTVEMLGNTGTAKDHLQPWCHHPGTESQIAHFHSRIIQSWQLLRPSIRIRVDTLSRCSCSLFRFFGSNASSTLLGSPICWGQHLVLSHVHMHFCSRLPCALGEFRYPESKKLNGLEPRIVGFAEHITRCLDCTQRMMWDMIRAYGTYIMLSPHCCITFVVSKIPAQSFTISPCFPRRYWFIGWLRCRCRNCFWYSAATLLCHSVWLVKPEPGTQWFPVSDQHSYDSGRLRY